LKRRAAEAQLLVKEPYAKMMRAVENGNRMKWIAAIKKFYDVAEHQTSYTSLPEATRRQIEDQDNDSLKASCKELCTEAITETLSAIYRVEIQETLEEMFTELFCDVRIIKRTIF
jgi:hypothetical protein